MTLLLLLLLFCGHSDAGYGGNDLFTSMEAMRKLWVEEKVFVQKLQDIVNNIKDAIPVMEKYVENHKKLKLDLGEPNVEYLGHPVNAFNLIKHAAIGWRPFHYNLNSKLKETFNGLKYVLEREANTTIPDHEEIHGAAFGLARLHVQYDLNTELLTKEGVIKTKLNMKNVKTPPSAIKLSTSELYEIAAEAFQQKIFTTGIDFLKTALELYPIEQKLSSDNFLHTFTEPKYNMSDMKQGYAFQKNMHDLKLVRHNSKGEGYFLFKEPVGSKLSKQQIKEILKREKKKYKWIKSDEVEDPYGRNTKADHYQIAEHQARIEYQKYQLCKGKSFRNDTETKDLKCFYGHAESPWLKLGPLKIEIQSHDPYIAVLRELMYPHECDDVTKSLSPYLGKPPGSSKRGGSTKNDWTMKNAWPDEQFNPSLEKMTRRVEHISNLWASSFKNQSDNFMCGNYGIGGHYGTHPDYYNFKNPSELINRVSTVMTVLDAPEAGGATVWPFVGVYVFPEKGSAVWWFNTRSDSVPDVDTKHAACPVLLGQKWIGNKWIGYTPQHHNRPCDLQPYTRYKGVYPAKND